MTRTKEELQAELDKWHTKYIQCCKDKYEIATRELELSAKLRESERLVQEYRDITSTHKKLSPGCFGVNLDELPIHLDCVSDGKAKISFTTTPPKKEKKEDV